MNIFLRFFWPRIAIELDCTVFAGCQSGTRLDSPLAPCRPFRGPVSTIFFKKKVCLSPSATPPSPQLSPSSAAHPMAPSVLKASLLSLLLCPVLHSREASALPQVNLPNRALGLAAEYGTPSLLKGAA